MAAVNNTIEGKTDQEILADLQAVCSKVTAYQNVAGTITVETSEAMSDKEKAKVLGYFRRQDTLKWA